MALDLWLELRLSEADAGALAGELRSLFHRFQARSKNGRRRYLVHGALASTP